MENKIVVFYSPIDPITKEPSETETFPYRAEFLGWGVQSELIEGHVFTNTMAIICAVECDDNGLYPVSRIAPELISFE